MTGRQHATIGLGLSLAAGVAVAAGALPAPAVTPVWLGGQSAVVQGAALVTLTIGGGLLGSVLPDLDTDRSLLESAPRRSLSRLRRRRSPLLWLLLAPVLVVLSLLLWLTNEIIMLVTGHRGLTHSLLALLLATTALTLLTGWAVGPMLGLGLGVGYASHLLADMLTPQGVALAAPWTNRRWYLLPRSLRFPGESWRGQLVTSLVLLASLSAALWRLWQLARS